MTAPFNDRSAFTPVPTSKDLFRSMLQMEWQNAGLIQQYLVQYMPAWRNAQMVSNLDITYTLDGLTGKPFVHNQKLQADSSTQHKRQAPNKRYYLCDVERTDINPELNANQRAALNYRMRRQHAFTTNQYILKAAIGNAYEPNKRGWQTDEDPLVAGQLVDKAFSFQDDGGYEFNAPAYTTIDDYERIFDTINLRMTLQGGDPRFSEGMNIAIVDGDWFAKYWKLYVKQNNFPNAVTDKEKYLPLASQLHQTKDYVENPQFMLSVGGQMWMFIPFYDQDILGTPNILWSLAKPKEGSTTELLVPKVMAFKSGTLYTSEEDLIPPTVEKETLIPLQIYTYGVYGSATIANTNFHTPYMII